MLRRVEPPRHAAAVLPGSGREQLHVAGPECERFNDGESKGRFSGRLHRTRRLRARSIIYRNE
jgi:hypothetical protein